MLKNRNGWAPIGASPRAQHVKNLPAMQETQEMQVWPLGWEDPLKEEIAAHSSVLAWKIPWTEESGGYSTKTEESLTWRSSAQVQLSRVWHSVSPWTAARQASLSITDSWSSLKLMSIESVMPSNHLILCHPLLLLPSIFPSIRAFSNESVLCIRWPKYWSFSFSISPSNEHSGLISFRMDWLDLPAVQWTLKSLLQHHSSKAPVLQCSAFFTIQLSYQNKQNLVCTRTQEKGAVTPWEAAPDLPGSVQGSLADAWVGGGTEGGSACRGPSAGGDIIFITSAIVWSNNRAGTQPRPSTEVGLKVYWARPRRSEQVPASPTVSPIRKLPVALYPYLSEGGKNENHGHRKLTKLITWATALSNSVRLWAKLHRAPQDRWVTVARSDRTWPTGEGDGRPLQHSCLQSPGNTVKGAQHKVFQ